MTAFFTALLDISLVSCWLIAAVVLLRLVFRKRAPKWVLCVLWGVVALRLVLPFSIQSPFGLVPERASAVSSAFAAAETEQIESPSHNAYRPAEQIARPARQEDQPVAPARQPETQLPVYAVTDPADPEQTDPAAAPADPVGPVAEAAAAERGAAFYLAVVWAFGFAAMIIYALANYLHLRRRVADSVRCKPGVRQSDRVSTPFVLGLFRPKIYMPFGLDAKTEEYVLAHERSHISRGDHWFKFIWFAVLSLHWFNPLVWLAFVFVCDDIEYACDERVCRDMAEDDRRLYATALLGLGTRSRRLAACPVAFGESNVKSRVKRLFSFKKPAFWLLVLIIVACTALTACFLTVNADIAEGSSSEESSIADESPLAEESSEPEQKENEFYGIKTICYAKYLEIPSGVYRCEELGMTITVINKPDYEKMEISIDGNEHAWLEIGLSSTGYGKLNVWPRNTAADDTHFSGSYTINEDGSLDLLIEKQLDAEKYGVEEGMTLHFVKISGNSD